MPRDEITRLASEPSDIANELVVVDAVINDLIDRGIEGEMVGNVPKVFEDWFWDGNRILLPDDNG
jgi:hypothetical protein